MHLQIPQAFHRYRSGSLCHLFCHLHSVYGAQQLKGFYLWQWVYQDQQIQCLDLGPEDPPWNRGVVFLHKVLQTQLEEEGFFPFESSIVRFYGYAGPDPSWIVVVWNPIFFCNSILEGWGALSLLPSQQQESALFWWNTNHALEVSQVLRLQMGVLISYVLMIQWVLIVNKSSCSFITPFILLPSWPSHWITSQCLHMTDCSASLGEKNTHLWRWVLGQSNCYDKPPPHLTRLTVIMSKRASCVSSLTCFIRVPPFQLLSQKPRLLPRCGSMFSKSLELFLFNHLMEKEMERPHIGGFWRAMKGAYIHASHILWSILKQWLHLRLAYAA